MYVLCEYASAGNNNSTVQEKVVVHKYAAQQMAGFLVIMLPDGHSFLAKWMCHVEGHSPAILFLICCYNYTNTKLRIILVRHVSLDIYKMVYHNISQIYTKV